MGCNALTNFASNTVYPYIGTMIHMFNSFAASFLGFLIAALSTVGGHATITVSSDTASPMQATSTEVQVDDTFIVGLANALVRLQSRFEHGNSQKEDHSISDDDSNDSFDERSDSDDDSDDSNDRREDSKKSSSVQSERRGEPELRGREEEGEEEFEEEDENEFEDEGDDDDERDTSGSSGTSQSGTSGTSGSSGTNGSSSTGGSVASTFTLSDVAKHNTSTSCYSAINGGVYDLTSWISKHPGGQNAIKGICGVDGSAAFNGQHGGSGRPESVLAGYKIGTLK